MNLDIFQKRYTYRTADCIAANQGQHEQRQPSNPADNDYATPHHFQRVSADVCATQQLEKRPSQDDRKIPGIGYQTVPIAERIGMIPGKLRQHGLRRSA
jgi:hypothetical protein